MKLKKKKTILLLEDGTIFKGWSYNNTFTCFGEVVFNTGMSGYQEIITDPSYYGQLTILTYPEIGNTGFNIEDNESNGLKSFSLIIKNFCLFASNWRMKICMFDYLNYFKLPVMFGMDTRSLTKYLRDKGSMNGCISNEQFKIEDLYKQLKNKPSMKGLNLIKYLETNKKYRWKNLGETILDNNKTYYYSNNIKSQSYKYKDETKLAKFIILDFGTKFNILRSLSDQNCTVKVFNHTYKIEDIKLEEHDGVILSNGPGDPLVLEKEINLIKELIKLKKLIFGICLGHQLLNIALGGKTFKMKFGHRAINHPCGLDIKVKITSQNHGFSVEDKSINKELIQINNLNLNDHTIAAISHKELPIFSIQYHPEGAPGPHDNHYIFEKFVNIARLSQIKNKYINI
uniref:carbamoyl-phosphate synthase arginine-specific small subunit n=1 Tax=Galdieria phlegrea TaxID=1389228 RepID=UPI0023D86865|nr:carbamoyl-phosphate synthase arginine-specific small subunit [Galdieria phlegrea]WDA99827.1 carbamoyl-phosphate synthase arginine-specific small subunit [Galdieria phlegrea]|eukprot:jgi/Galph1/1550/GphlegSOOS_G239.1